jgi:possible amidohydrolase
LGRFYKTIIKGDNMVIIYSDKIVLQDDIQEGYIKIDKDVISSIEKEITDEERKYVLDYSGCYIMPGIINISSSNIEKKEALSPSVGTQINKLREIEYAYASSGVTTVYHSLYLTEKKIKNIEEDKIKTIALINNIKKYDSHPASIIDNKTHLKFQIKSIRTMDDVKFLLDEKLLDFVSYEIKSYDKDNRHYKDQYMQEFMQTNLNLTEDMADKVIDRIKQLREESNIDELAYLIKYAHFKGVRVCTPEFSSASKIYNEFKDTTDIIKITKENNNADIQKDVFFKLINVSRILSCNDCSLVDENTIISSDRKPNDLLVFIGEMRKYRTLSEISKFLSRNPADALGLFKKGEIKQGYTADLIALKFFDEEEPVVVGLIKDGKVKFNINV